MEKNLVDLYQKWNELNTQFSESFLRYEFDSIRDVRDKQRKIEDLIYSILLENAPDDIKKILPETCDVMELGYEPSTNKFYFLMEDPEEVNDNNEEIKILAITIDSNKKINTIKNFQPNQTN